MKKSTLFLTVVFVAAAVAILGYAYVIFGNRYGNQSEEETVNANSNSLLESVSDYLGGQSDKAAQGQNNNGNQNENSNTNNNGNDNNSNVNKNAPAREEFTSKDCNNDCARFECNEENYRYCQQVCGDIPIAPKNSSKECDGLSGLEKDYCFKDLAISKKDYQLCGNIQDAKVKKVCRDRITEDLLQ